MKKVLIITYYWPPSGGAGVQRWLKFSKYLPGLGWEPVILTVDPEYAAYPATDTTFEKEIPHNLKVYRTKATDWFRFYSGDKSKIPSAGFALNPDNSIKGKFFRFIRGNFFIPDPRRGWNRYAVRTASRLIQNENISHFITTSPPHSSQLIGLQLKRKFPATRWIADLRDTWTDIYYYEFFYPTLLSRTIDGYFEKKVIRKADQLIMVGQHLAETYLSKCRSAVSKVHIIPNGYDEEDFKETEPSFPDRYTITYVGTLSEAYPVDTFLSALTTIESSGIDFLLRFVGSVSAETRMKVTSYLSAAKTEFISYTDHQEAIRYMCRSSLLVLIIPEHRKNRAITPGKVFEYIAACKPVLYIGPPDGDAAGHLKLCGQKGIFSGKDAEEMSDFIIENIQAARPNHATPHPEYSRRILTQMVDKVLKGD